MVTEDGDDRRFTDQLLKVTGASAHTPVPPDPDELARQLPALEAADRLHARLCDLVSVLPPEDIWEADWERADEDWVRDAVEDAAAYASHRQFGEDNHIYLAEGYPVGLAYADTLRGAAAGLVVTLTGADDEPPAEVAAVQDAIRRYEELRRPLGGGPYA